MFYGWRIVAACFTILFVIVGIDYYSFPVFYAPLIEEFGWSRAQVTAGFFLSLVVVGPLFGVSAGFLIDRYGTKRIMLVGLAFAGTAFLGYSLMHSLALYYLFYFMQTIGYVVAGPVPNQVLISHWFTRMRGRAMGLAYVGGGVGGAVAPVLAEYLIRRYGWREAMVSITGMILLVLVPLTIALVKDRPAELGLQPDGACVPGAGVEWEGKPPAGYCVVKEPDALRARGPVTDGMNLARAMKTRAFWMILTGSMMSIGAVGGVIQHLQLYLRDQRFAPEHAARLASFLLVASILGRVTMGYLADRFSRKYVMLAACLMIACAIPFLYIVKIWGVVYLFAFIFGFGMGADYMLIPLITAECFGLASLGRLMGVILTTDALAQAFAPVMVGRIYDLHRSYDWGFGMLAAMAVIGAAAVSQIPMPRRHARGV